MKKHEGTVGGWESLGTQRRACPLSLLGVLRVLGHTMTMAQITCVHRVAAQCRKGARCLHMLTRISIYMHWCVYLCFSNVVIAVEVAWCSTSV